MRFRQGFEHIEYVGTQSTRGRSLVLQSHTFGWNVFGSRQSTIDTSLWPVIDNYSHQYPHRRLLASILGLSHFGWYSSRVLIPSATVTPATKLGSNPAAWRPSLCWFRGEQRTRSRKPQFIFKRLDIVHKSDRYIISHLLQSENIKNREKFGDLF